MTFRLQSVVLSKSQFLRPQASFGVLFILEAYFDMLSLNLVEKGLGSLSMGVEIGILKALKFSGDKL